MNFYHLLPEEFLHGSRQLLIAICVEYRKTKPNILWWLQKWLPRLFKIFLIMRNLFTHNLLALILPLIFKTDSFFYFLFVLHVAETSLRVKCWLIKTIICGLIYTWTGICWTIDFTNLIPISFRCILAFCLSLLIFLFFLMMLVILSPRS